MSRLVLFVLALGVAVTLAANAVGAEPPVQHFAQKSTLGFYRGAVVEYLDFGPVKLAPGNKTAPIWVFTNGAAGQRNVIDTVPGKADYSPLWSVTMVTWKNGVARRVLRSAAAVRRAIAAGQASSKEADVVVNCPVI
jgi:hypothetical protein